MLGGGPYEATTCPECGSTMWNGRCENPDCKYHWHQEEEEGEEGAEGGQGEHDADRDRADSAERLLQKCIARACG